MLEEENAPPQLPRPACEKAFATADEFAMLREELDSCQSKLESLRRQILSLEVMLERHDARH